jgi:hypothetical protein
MPDGQLVRLVYGRELEVYSPIDGSLTSVSLGPLDTPSAKPAYATMQLQNDNLLFIAKPVTGQAVVLDPNSSFEVLAQLTFPVPPNAGGGPTSKAVLSADGATLYTLGQGLSGGIDAYAVPSGTPVASQADGNQYNGIYILPSGTIIAIQQVNPRLSFFDSSLNSIATADTNLSVVGVF